MARSPIASLSRLVRIEREKLASLEAEYKKWIAEEYPTMEPAPRGAALDMWIIHLGEQRALAHIAAAKLTQAISARRKARGRT